MKKEPLLLILLITSLYSLSQEKIQDRVARLYKNTTGIPYDHNKAAGKFYNIRGTQLYVETYGTGEPLLMMHGNGGNMSHFFGQIPYFQKKNKVIVVDSRAQGRSVDKGDSLTYEMMADDMAALLDSMQMDSVNVIGWSDGGINALLLAIRHPEKVKRMAITGANLTPDSTAIFPEVNAMDMRTYTILKNKAEKTELEKSIYKFVRLVVEQPNISLEDLHKITAPVLVIAGDHDVIKPEHTLLIAKNISRSYLWVLPDSGHSTPIIYKELFNETVDRFLAKPYRTFDARDRLF